MVVDPDELLQQKIKDGTIEFTYMKYNIYFMKFVTVYPIDRDANILIRLVFIFMRYLNIFCLVGYPIQATMDLASRENITLVDLAPNIMHICKFIF